MFFRSNVGSKLERALGRLGAVILGQMGVMGVVCCRRAPPKRMGDGVSRLGRVVVVCRRRPQTLLDLALGRGSLGRGAPPAGSGVVAACSLVAAGGRGGGGAGRQAAAHDLAPQVDGKQAAPSYS